MHEYSVVENDGKIAVINDKAYTEVYRNTIGGKDCRMAITVDKKESSWGTDYTVQNTNKWYGNEREVLRAPPGKDGKWKTKKAKFFFKTNVDTHVLTIGRSRKGRDESINSIYFFYGQESTPYFRRKIIDEKANIVSNNSGLHVADGNTDRFGWGVHKIKTFDSGWYGEALCQYALFNRHIHTVHDGIYGSRKANVQGKDIALSLGIGRKINLFSDKDNLHPVKDTEIIRRYICRTIQMAYVYLHSGLGNKKSQCRAQRRRFGHTEDAGAEKKGLNHWSQTLFLSAARSVFPSYCVRHLVATANGCRSIYS